MNNLIYKWEYVFVLLIFFILSLVGCKEEVYTLEAPPEYHVWDTLTEEGAEKTGYAMYTYVLFGRRLDNITTLNSEILNRYQNLLEAIIASTPSAIEAREWPKELSNIFYIPGIKAYIGSFSLLNNYNSSLAMSYIVALSKVIEDSELQQRITMRPGPFLISMLYPLKQLNNNGVVMLYADLSESNPAAIKEIVNTYKRHIINRTIDEVERFNPLRLAILNLILNVDDNLKIVKVALADWLPENK
jgi:hypothetical protein